MKKQRKASCRKNIRGTRAHILRAYLAESTRLFEYFPFLHMPLSRLCEGTHTKTDLDEIAHYVLEMKGIEQKFLQIEQKFREFNFDDGTP